MRFSFILFFCFPFFLIAQEHPCPDALFRYWELKNRLHKHFVRLDHWGDGIGQWDGEKMRFEKAGYSLPAAQLIVVPQACTYWQYLFDSGYTPSEVLDNCSLPNVLKWGDTTVDLGYYLALLATEYELLGKNGQFIQQEKTTHEIFLALQAYRRLDMTANYYYHQWKLVNDPDCVKDYSYGMCGQFTQVPDLSGYSGFFLRDDVPHDFRYYFNENADGDSTWQVGGVRGGLSSSEDDPIGNFLPDMNSISGDNVLSQDQMIGILFGLSFVHRYVSDSETVLGNNIIGMVEKIAEGMLNHIRPADEVVAAYRSIRYPGCMQNVKVERGHNASNFYFAINRAISNINVTAPNCTDGEDKQKWEAFGKRACNCNIPFYENCGFNCRMLLELFAMTDEGSIEKMQERALSSNKEAHILAWYVLQSDKYNVSDISQAVFLRMKKALFESPPICHGPCYRATEDGKPKFECPNEYGWCGGNRMTSGNFKASSCNYEGFWYIRGGGVGYMLMYNLFMLTYYPNVPYFNPEMPEGEIPFKLPNIFLGERSVCYGGSTMLSVPDELLPFEHIAWTTSQNLNFTIVDVDKKSIELTGVNNIDTMGWVNFNVLRKGCERGYFGDVVPQISELLCHFKEGKISMAKLKN